MTTPDDAPLNGPLPDDPSAGEPPRVPPVPDDRHLRRSTAVRDAREYVATNRKRNLIIGILALALASVAMRFLRVNGLSHSAAVFIGIPTLLALVVASASKPKSGTGVVMRVITLALLLSSIVFAEGMVCILFAAPIFYLAGFLGVQLVSFFRDVRTTGRKGMMLIVLIVLPTGFEGVIPGVEWNREEAVTVSRVVRGTPADVSTALAARPSFSPALPPFLRAGFPIPVATRGDGLLVGSERTIVFAHAHGGHVEHGTLSFRIVEHDSQFVRFAPASDDSYITHWLTWRSSEVRWEAVSPGLTRVEWTLRYRRRLDPAWYFKPIERYGVGVAARYLIDALATPGVEPSTAAIVGSEEPATGDHHHGP